MESAPSRLGKKIARLRQIKGLTQEDLAETTGLDRSYLSHIERGVANPSLSTLLRISAALGVSICDLLCGGEEDDF